MLWHYYLTLTDDHKIRDLPAKVYTVTLTTNMVFDKFGCSCFSLWSVNGKGLFKMQGHLSDGTVIAVKQLSSESKQGSHEFITEIGMISALQHPNLVKLYGCCTERNQLLLVYEYMENNSLAIALFGKLADEHLLNSPIPNLHLK